MNILESMKALVEGKKIRAPLWKPIEFMHIKDGRLVDENGYSINLDADIPYELYEEPKQKVKLYQWAFKSDGRWYVSCYHPNKESLDKWLFDDVESIRLDWSMIEVDA